MFENVEKSIFFNTVVSNVLVIDYAFLVNSFCACFVVLNRREEQAKIRPFNINCLIQKKLKKQVRKHKRIII